MQAVARSSLSPLDIPVAQREFRRDNKSYEPDTITGTVSAPSSAANSPAPVDPTPLSPLSTPNCFDSSSSASPPSFPASSAPSSSAASAHEEILLLNNRYLLLECVEGSVSPQSQPLRRCIDTVTGTTYFCRECQRSEATASLLAAHNRLRDSDVVTPIYETISASLDDEQQNSSSSSKLYLISPASYGDLHTYLRSKRRLKESEARSLFRQAAQAVNDCHRHGVVLTDLKLRRFVFADPQRYLHYSIFKLKSFVNCDAIFILHLAPHHRHRVSRVSTRVRVIVTCCAILLSLQHPLSPTVDTKVD